MAGTKPRFAWPGLNELGNGGIRRLNTAGRQLEGAISGHIGPRVDYVVPQEFGAAADGVRDAAPAIQQAITVQADPGGVVMLPPGRYAVEETIRLIQGVTLLMHRDAVLVARANVNILEVVAESKVEGGAINVEGVSGFTAAAVFVDGTTGPTINQNKNKTIVKDLDLIGQFEGDAVYVSGVGPGPGTRIDWLYMSDVKIAQFNRALVLEADSTNGSPVWVNGNVFHGFRMSGCVRFIEILGLGQGPENTSGNVFSDLQIQPRGSAPQTERVIFCTGDTNFFTGKIWDLHLPSDAQPLKFTETSAENICIFPSVPGDEVDDKGDHNWFLMAENRKLGRPDMIFPGAPVPISFAGDQDDFLSNADQRYTVSQTAGDAPNNGTFDNLKNRLFNGSRSVFVSWTASANDQIIEIDFGGAEGGMDATGLIFGSGPPAEVTIEADSDGMGSWVTIYSTSANESRFIAAYHRPFGVQTAHALRITLADTASEINLDRIFSFNTQNLGRRWLSTSGAEMFGSIGLHTRDLPGVANAAAGRVAGELVKILGGPGAASGALILSEETYAGGIAAVSDAGGATAVIQDDPDAEFRICKTSDGAAHTRLFAMTSAGAIQQLATSNGPVGTLTLANAATTQVANTSTTPSSLVFLFPTNAAASTLVGSAASPYISAVVGGTRFDVSTADASSAAGTETFNYLILN